jgi:hypothetical protein
MYTGSGSIHSFREIIQTVIQSCFPPRHLARHCRTELCADRNCNAETKKLGAPLKNDLFHSQTNATDEHRREKKAKTEKTSDQ